MALLDMFGRSFLQCVDFCPRDYALYLCIYCDATSKEFIIPSMQKLQREGESGRRQDKSVGHYHDMVLLVQAPAYLMNLHMQMMSAGGALSAGSGLSCMRPLYSLVVVCLFYG